MIKTRNAKNYLFDIYELLTFPDLNKIHYKNHDY
jgi:hypothetical protein